MILQSLNELHSRLKDEEGNPYGIPSLGYSVQNVTFRIVLNSDGSLVDIQDARETITETTKSGKIKTKQVARQVLVPGESKPAGGGINPCTLWDNTSYLLGYKKPDKDPTKASKDSARALQTLAATKEHYLALTEGQTDLCLLAIRSFYENHWSAEKADKYKAQLDDFAATGFGVFRILPNHLDAHETEPLKTWWDSRQLPPTDKDIALCLVTGEEHPIARIHDPAIKGVNGAAPGGAKLASFEKKSFRSYGKDQSFNSPVSEKVVFAYCNTLNALLSGPQSHRHRVAIGDVTTIFWTEQKTKVEASFAQFLGGAIAEDIDEDSVQQQNLQAFLNTLRKGGGANINELDDKPHTKFYLLGLSGNVTRLVVRFWHISTVAEIMGQLQEHYQNLSLIRKKNAHPFYEPEFPSVQRLLDQTARERKAISPLLGAQLMQSILHGTLYPMGLLQGVLSRLRANEEVSYLKAAILKALLIRNFNLTIDMSLNTERTEPAYLLGRLFAALEKTQEDALGKINSGIRERFYSSASTTPSSVFPRILRTYQHHLAKLDGGIKTNRERLIQGIHAPLDGYPNHLNLEEQSLFAIGYYHQRQDFFTSKKEQTSENS